MKKEELHDEVCRVLTWYEKPDEYAFGEKALKEDITEMMYKLLVRIDNEVLTQE